jgi:hypothetical protein
VQSSLSPPISSALALLVNMFLLSDWICTGRSWPEDPPCELEDALATLLAIPAHVNGAIPSRDMPIFDFVQYRNFPSRLTSPMQPQLSVSVPSIVPYPLSLVDLPAHPIIQSLKDDIRQQWLNGAQSIAGCYLGFNLPLWTITYWERMTHVMSSHALWTASLAWFEETLIPTTNGVPLHLWHVAPAARRFFWTVGWDVRLNQQCSSLELAALFGNHQLYGTLLDVVLLMLDVQVRDMPEHIGTRITTLDVQWALQQDEAWSDYNHHPSLKALRALGSDICNGACQKVFVPVHVNGNHYSAFEINIPDRQISYGDSMGWLPPSADVRRIRRWMVALGLKSFTMGPSLQCPTQDDAYSCPILVWYMVRERYLGLPAWNSQFKHVLRVEFALLVAISDGEFLPVCFPLSLRCQIARSNYDTNSTISVSNLKPLQ